MFAHFIFVNAQCGALWKRRRLMVDEDSEGIVLCSIIVNRKDGLETH
jgi:hypothetical protein